MIYKILQIKLKIEQHEIYLKPGMKYSAPVLLAVPTVLVQHELKRK